MKKRTNGDPLTVKWVTMLALFFISCAAMPAMAQNGARNMTLTGGPVKGRVLDKDGKPVAAATIVVRGKRTSTSTSDDGSFTIQAGPGDVLVVSSIGYDNNEIRVGNRSELAISLGTRVNSLNDVVVVGYGTVKKKDLTGAVAVVNVADAKKNETYDVARMLQGQVAGVSVQGSGEPGGTVNIKIRGISSFNDNNPLFVIDGVPIVNEAPFDFPVDDIETVQILKDASAGAIYGSRGSGGVIIITTKKGKVGPMRVRYSGYLGAQNIPKKLSLTDRAGFQKITDQAEKNAGIPLAAANDPTSPNFISNTNTNWQDAAFKTGIIQNHSLNFSGGAQTTTYSVSMNYFDQTATIKGGPGEPKYNRYNIDANMQSKAGILSFGAKLAYTVSHKQNITYPHLHPNVGNELVDLDRAIPTVPILDSNRLGGYGGTDQITQKSIVLNIIGMNNLMDSYSNRDRFLGNAWAELDILKNLKYRLNLVYDRTETRDFFFEPKYDLGWYYLNNTAYMTDTRGAFGSYLMEHTLTYDVTAGKSKLQVLGGYAFAKDNFSNLTGIESGFTPPYFYSFGTGDPTTASVQSLAATDVLISYLGRVTYNYDDRYLLTGNFRRDGSSKFSPSNRWGNFGGVSAAWNIANEKFIHLPEAISQLKLRGGYGSLGNQNFPGSSLVNSYYPYTTFVNTNASYLFGPANSGTQTLAPGTTQTQVADPTIKWETKITSDVAVDLGLFNNSIEFTAEYFANTDKNLIAQPPIPLSVGATNIPYVNAASLQNKGLEFTASYHHTAGPFTYQISGNVHTLKNKVLKLGGFNDPIYGIESITQVGGEVGEIYGYKTEGIFQSAADVSKHALQPNAAAGDVKYKDMDGNDTINALDRTNLGSAIPKVYFGFNFSVSYRNIDFSFFVEGSAGNKIVNGTYQALMAGQYTNHSTDELNYWTPTNTNTNVPRPIIGDPNGNDGVNDRWVQSGSYAKLQNATLGYNFPERALGATKVFKSARIYVSGQNLLTITKYKGYDPDIASDGLFSRAFDYGSIPNPRTLTIGVQVGF